MPGLRSLLVAAGVGTGVAAYTLLWWNWPLAAGVGAGILLGALAMTGTISVGQNGADADAAWRAAAPDLVEAPAEPDPRVEHQPPPRVSDGPDLPSGD